MARENVTTYGETLYTATTALSLNYWNRNLQVKIMPAIGKDTDTGFTTWGAFETHKMFVITPLLAKRVLSNINTLIILDIPSQNKLTQFTITKEKIVIKTLADNSILEHIFQQYQFEKFIDYVEEILKPISILKHDIQRLLSDLKRTEQSANNFNSNSNFNSDISDLPSNVTEGILEGKIDKKYMKKDKTGSIDEDDVDSIF